MELRRITEDDLGQVFGLISQAFMRGGRDDGWIRDPSTQAMNGYGVFEGATLKAQAAIAPYECHMGGDLVMKMGGIAGVACHPTARGKGYAGMCMRRALEGMRDEGQTISTLFPFSWAYYRRLGWAWVGEKRRYGVPTSAMQSCPETRHVRAAEEADHAAVQELYGRFAAGYRGLIARDEAQWKQMLGHAEKEFTYTYLYPADGTLEGYLTYRGGSRDSTHLRELICRTPAAKRALLGLLRRHDMQVSRFEWEAPADDDLRCHLCHWDLETRTAPVTQGRIVDVPAALRAWGASRGVEASFIVRVADPSAPWNDGTWTVTAASGEASVAPTTTDPGIEIEIGELSQCLYGAPTTGQLRRAGLITVHDEAQCAAMERFFAGPPMWTNDSF